MLTLFSKPTPIAVSPGAGWGVPIPRRDAGWRLEAPAKINLFLEVVGKREDGFHTLETVMAPLRLADRLTFTPRPTRDGVRLTVIGPMSHTAAGVPIPADHRNLVVRALDLLQQHVGERFGANVLLEKQVPAEAGLGGGSSDAAAALLLANHAWRLRMSDNALHAVASQVGSDVPFFLTSGAAICRGRGEIIEPLAAPRGCPCVVVKPDFGLSTAKVFGRIAGQLPNYGVESVEPIAQALVAGDWRSVAGRQFNRLQEFATQVAEGVRSIAERLARIGPLEWMMTGSGSAFFALASNALVAQRVASIARRRGIGWAAATSLG